MSNRPIGVNIYLSALELEALQKANAFLADLADRRMSTQADIEQAQYGMEELFKKIDAARHAQVRKAGIRSGLKLKGQKDSNYGKNQGSN